MNLKKPFIRPTLDEIERYFAADFTNISRVPPPRIASDLLNPDKVKEQVSILSRFVGPLRGKRILEMGSGFGNFLVYGALNHGLNVLGVEPGRDDFQSAFAIAKNFLVNNEILPPPLVNSAGEHLPFKDNSFDVIYSTNVLEHVQNPERFIREAVRVTKNRGIIQIVVPNYGSFFEPHFKTLWIPYLPHFLAKGWLWLLRKKNLSFIDTIQFINYFTIRRIISRLVHPVKIITTGEEIFLGRMSSIEFGDWGGLDKIKKWLKLIHRIKIVGLVARLLVYCKAFTPLVITLEKK